MMQSVPRTFACHVSAQSVSARADDGLGGISVVHSAVHGWALKLLPVLARCEEVMQGWLNGPPRRLVQPSFLRGFSLLADMT
ncbi:hypothetical protein BN2475_810003 [Paraburkholderia ribeironis]|uniref:Uncharacterized protein n=1 Tax=Paraburkholderia ribeironis TaxID=1247936 RepID=A0A1N7SK39_9BURK|nr:hypothetical protein BN2475_810003 [Paraburkholderia ribeironis]